MIECLRNAHRAPRAGVTPPTSSLLCIRDAKATRPTSPPIAPPEALVDGIASAADGADRIALPAFRQFLAQASDVNIDGAFVDLDRAPPHQIEQLRSREHAPRLFEEIFQQPKIGRAEANVPIAAPDA